MSLLDVRGLRAGYEGVPVVFGIDLDIGEREIVALLGSNGAGKTTTLRAISGAIAPMAGEVVFDGRRVAGLAAERIARAGLMHVPAGRGIFPNLTVADTLRLAAATASGAEAVDVAYDVFPRLAERRGQTAGTLSGGEQQMLALARGLIARPKLLMVDEMSQGLAPTLVADLFARIASFPKRGVSVLLVEQFVSRALHVADRAYVLEKGEITFAGPASKLARDRAFVHGSYLGGKRGPRRRRRSVEQRRTESVSLRLPPALLRRLEERAEAEGVPLADLVTAAVERTADSRNGTRSTTRKRRR